MILPIAVKSFDFTENAIYKACFIEQACIDEEGI